MVVQKLVKKLVLNEIEKKLNEQGRRNDVMPGLVPIGDTGLYGSSLEPVSPFDCARYPDSPYCGGFPISFQPFGFGLQLVKDNCNLGVRVNPTVAFIKFPPLVLVYRKPECRELPPEPLPVAANYSSPVRIPPNNCQESNSPSICILFRDSASFHESIDNIDGEGSIAESSQNETVSITQFDFPVTPTETKRVGGLFGAYDAPVVGYITARRQGIFKANAKWLEVFHNDFDGVDKEFPINEISTFKITYAEDDTYRLFPGANLSSRLGLFFINKFPTPDYLDRNDYFNRAGTETDEYYNNKPYSEPYLVRATNFFQEHYTVLVKCGKYSSSNRNNPAPPLQEEPCCMKCCPPHDDSLVKLLIKKIDKLSEIVGVDDYPVKVPKSLITKSEGFPGNLIPDGEVEVPSLTRLQTWYVERFDEIMGQWEIPIEIKDSDPNTPGDQPKGIKLPNMAEAVAEMFTLMYQSYLNSELMLNLSTRNLLEAGQDKRQNFVTYKLLLSLTDYLGYKYKEVKAEMALMFTPEKVSFDELLKETKISVAVPEFDEKLNFQSTLMRYNKAASIIDSVFFRRVNPSGDIKGQLMSTLLGLLASMKDFDEKTEDNFEQFIEDAEIGFTNTPGVTDTQNPYGRSYSQRPRIRDLSQLDDQPDGTQ